MRRLTLRERMSLGDAVGRIRARQRCTQAEFGGILGVPQSMISDWERGVRMPTVVRGTHGRGEGPATRIWSGTAKDGCRRCGRVVLCGIGNGCRLARLG